MRTSLVLRILVGFVAGSALGLVLRNVPGSAAAMNLYIEPFGAVFVNMLKMIVIPVIFFSLVVGTASLPIQRFGRIGAKVLGWYLATSLAAALLGVAIALAVSPASGTTAAEWQALAGQMAPGADSVAAAPKSAAAGFRDLLLSMFENPFSALARGNFLAIIVFSILFGLAIGVLSDSSGDTERSAHLRRLVGLLSAARDGMFKLVDWVLEYSPVGVFALSMVNFGTYGTKIIGPYLSATLGVAAGILLMVFGVYSVLLRTVTGRNPLRFLKAVREPMIMAFVTRSSAATLPVTLKTAREELKIHSDLAGFSLPLGATINMDGVCVHLPMFAVLAANMFGLHLTPFSLIVLVLTTVLASIGAGGVPGGSLMLLFIILEPLGLNPQQVAVIVALALGINPILDMFETMNNVTGDLACTYAVAANEKLLEGAPAE
ncbi:MAG: dicarboxylate/amino acid:cation symporter [Candidatus Sumerlaeia bacterium]|nr:dicarboxylate/amino acid:cation symporter [Candidatus Sumerlaeia bacterium]